MNIHEGKGLFKEYVQLLGQIRLFTFQIMYRYNLLPTFPDLPGCNDSSFCCG